jgi:hypothetical protein
MHEGDPCEATGVVVVVSREHGRIPDRLGLHAMLAQDLSESHIAGVQGLPAAEGGAEPPGA